MAATEQSRTVLRTALLCVLPVAIIPIAALTTVGGPCAGITGPTSAIVLFGTAVLGVISVIAGFLKWRRVDAASLPAVRLTKIATIIIGLGAMLLNGAFALFAGLTLAAMSYAYLYFPR
jgi:hypothetical protein